MLRPMRLSSWLALALSISACGGLHSRLDGGEGGGGGIGRGVGGGVGGGGGGGGGVGGGGGGGGGSSTDGGCTLSTQCPEPPNSSAACTNGACTFACALPLLHCPNACCGAIAITAGDAHTCVITSEGGVKCWGAAATVGDGAFLERDAPTDVLGLSSKVLAISAGGSYTCAQLDNGGVECWGVNTIGNGGNVPAGLAKPVTLPGPASRLSSGGAHACVVADGGVLCWGSDLFGQQGTNGGGTRLTPGNVAGLVYDVSQVASGNGHGCALLVDGGARCWGRNVLGECGDGTAQIQRSVPVIVTAIDAGILELQAGVAFTCARTVAGGVKCWGANGMGECGFGVVSSRSLAAVSVVGVTPGLTQLALSGNASHACFVQDAGVYCWGNDDHGQLGDGNLGHQNVPVLSLGITAPVLAVAPGGRHTCAVTAPGGVLCWGDNSEGQLGDGTKGGNHLSPVQAR